MPGSGNGGSRLGGCLGLALARFAAYAANETLEELCRSRCVRYFCVRPAGIVEAEGFVLAVRGAVAVDELLSERVIEFSAVVEMERDFGPWFAPAVPAKEDNRDPGEPGLAITPGTSRPPLCLCLMVMLDSFNGEAVADRAGGTGGGLEDS